ncbi:PREDICTED: uncharacterized protein LOC109166517 [Ipomoea nil]|uniref:uncharacterized protein LOC109166517 n=1 Tax=Ipomoea nil TaxID=35883 RepID=UPI000901812B|nr:PREDICTED: uncharacterized protein LOC109166517 [Ipomoea nil]
MAASDPFGGSPTEDPNAHVIKFLRLCGTFKMNGVTQDAIRLRLFPFSLKDKADDWLSSHPDNHFDTWRKLHGEFLKKCYPISKTQRMRREIQNFKQLATESLTESWESSGANTSRGTIGDDCYEWVYLVLGEVSTKALGGIHEVEQLTDLSTKMDNVVSMVQKLAQITVQKHNHQSRVTGKLPASTENPRELVNAIVTRSGKVLEESSPPTKASIPNRTVEEKIEKILENEEVEPTAVKNNDQVIDEGKKHVRRYENPFPIPLQIRQQGKESKWKKFLEIVENLKIFVPLLHLLSQVPSYGKFLKEILTRKRKYVEHEMIAMTQEYRALTPGVGRRLTKYKDPRKFTIPCIVGGRPIKGSLCDIGASVSVMPLHFVRS